MIMEFIADGDLYHLLRKKTFAEPELAMPIRLKIAYDVACGMTYLHAVNPPIVHCDLRSPNVFLEFGKNTSGGVTVRAKVADFGLSRPVFVGATGFLNTWQWLPPEVIDLNSKGFTEMADVYSFAIIMWELMTGEFPFEEFDEVW
jgi:serine/threonine protein kinase